MAKKKEQAPPLSPAEAKEAFDRLDAVIQRFSGPLDELEAALGMYLLGRHVGWKVLYLIHTKRTVAKYEAILGIDVRSEFQEEGPGASRSLAFSAAKQFSNFWKVVSGEQKLDLDRDQRRSFE
jgi:hypothetical protein